MIRKLEDTIGARRLSCRLLYRGAHPGKVYVPAAYLPAVLLMNACRPSLGSARNIERPPKELAAPGRDTEADMPLPVRQRENDPFRCHPHQLPKRACKLCEGKMLQHLAAEGDIYPFGSEGQRTDAADDIWAQRRLYIYRHYPDAFSAQGRTRKPGSYANFQHAPGRKPQRLIHLMPVTRQASLVIIVTSIVRTIYLRAIRVCAHRIGLCFCSHAEVLCTAHPSLHFAGH